MKTDLEAERMAADAALGQAEHIGWYFAIASGIAAYYGFSSWLAGIVIAIAAYILVTRAPSRRHDAAWAKVDIEI